MVHLFSKNQVNMKKRILCLFVVLIAFVYIINAQKFNTLKGYIVKNSADTIYGFIKNTNNLNNEIIFMPEDGDGFIKYGPTEVASFRLETGKLYKSKHIVDPVDSLKRNFVLCLVDGKMSLYLLGEDFCFEKNGTPVIHMVQKDTVVTKYMINRNGIVTPYDFNEKGFVEAKFSRADFIYLGSIRLLLSDCKDLPDKLNQPRFSYLDMIDYVEEYNKCVYPAEKSTPYRKTVKSKIGFGIRVEYGNSIIKRNLPDNKEYQQSSQNQTMYGAFVNLGVGRYVSFQPEINYFSKTTTISYIENNYRNIEEEYDCDYLQIPVMAYFHLPTNFIRPNLSAGFVYGYGLNQSFVEKDLYYKKTVDIPLDKNEYGFRFGVGVQFDCCKKIGVNIEYINEFGNITMNDDERKSTYSKGFSVSLLLR